MNVRRPGFLLLVALAATAPLPAFGQSAPAARGGPQGAPTIPELSGFWVHPYFPGIEPPASGPGPLINRSRRPSGVGNSSQLVGDYTNPILKPQAAAVVKRLGEISLSGVTYPTPSNRCWPSGVPYIFFQPGIEVVQLPDRIVFLYLRDHEVRQVRMSRTHPAQVTPSWYGDSVGHYEGDTLVVDTVGVRTDRPFAMVDMYGAPYSSALRVVERYQLVDRTDAEAARARNAKENIRTTDTHSDLANTGRRLQLVFTVEDEAFYTTPWRAVITYEHPSQEWPENVCAENIFEFYTGKNDAVVPTASKPDF